MKATQSAFGKWHARLNSPLFFGPERLVHYENGMLPVSFQVCSEILAGWFSMVKWFCIAKQGRKELMDFAGK